MDSVDEEITLSALKFLCGEYNQICRLCLRFTDKQIHLDDTVAIQTPYYNKSISYITMLDDLNIVREPMLPHILCENCADLTTKSYVFLKLKQFTNDTWNNVLKCINKSLSQLKSIQSFNRSAYIIINKEHNILVPSPKSHRVNSKKVAILKDVMHRYRRHIQRKHKIKEFQCDECKKRFSCKEYLKKHTKLHKRSPKPCSKCLKVFLTAVQLEEHMERVHYPKTVQCSECMRKFGTEKMLQAHIKLHHIQVTCKYCNINFPSRLELRTHLDKHGTSTCENCKKKFRSQHTYRVHLKKCLAGKNKEKFICDYCSKTYSSKNGLVTHFKVAHDFGGKILSCKWCNKKFDAVSRLNNHIVTHTKEKKFHCEQCGGLFVTQAALTYHIRLHTGERPYPCELCGESFLSSSRRMEHKKRKHYGPKKECSLCQMRFLTKFRLRTHMRRHFDPSSKLYITESDFLFPKRVRAPHLFAPPKHDGKE